jgi:translation initiation factor IF-1
LLRDVSGKQKKKLGSGKQFRFDKMLFKMRGNKEGFTLRKGIVEKELAPSFYQIKDIITGKEIQTSLSGKLRVINFKLQIGEIVYVIVSKYDLTRGRLAIEGHRGGLEGFKKDKELLDNNTDPLKGN